MKRQKDDDHTVKADIPESVFEEALRAVERIRGEGHNPRSGPATAARGAANRSDADLDELMELIEPGGAPAAAAPGAAKARAPEGELEDDLRVLSKMLEEESNLEKEATFFKSVLFNNLEGKGKPIEATELTAKEGQIQDLLGRLSTLQGEFERFRQRITKEAETAKRFSNESLILQILPILDNLERAIAHADSTEEKAAMVQGVRLIHKQLLDVLAGAGLAPIDTEGKTFDPNYHEAIAAVAAPDSEPNAIISEYQRGYLLYDRLIRPARVIVAGRSETGAMRTAPAGGSATTGDKAVKE